MTPQEAWRTAQNQLQLQLDRPSYDTWIQRVAVLSYHPETRLFVMGAHSSMALEMLQHRYDRNIRRSLGDVMGAEIDVRYELVKAPEPTPPTYDPDDLPLFRYLSQQPSSDTANAPLHSHLRRPTLPEAVSSTLNPRYTLERFIVSGRNDFAYGAARAVAESPYGSYNPLFMYGGVGVGKTHLLQAIANSCNTRGLRVIYAQAEAFMNDLVESIRSRQQAMFREKYRNVDVLVIDDVQFIAGKESTQEEFFHTFNALYTYNKQIILASDRHPDELTTLEPRLRSRFAGGLIADIKAPEFEARVAILQMWAEEEQVYLESNMLEEIARRAPDNIRELLGVFNQVVAKVRFSARGGINLQEVTTTIERFTQPRQHLVKRPTPMQVLAAVAVEYELDLNTMMGKSRTRRLNEARQTAMYLMRELTDSSLAQVGDIFERTHSTVLHSCQKMSELMVSDAETARLVKRVRARLNAT